MSSVRFYASVQTFAFASRLRTCGATTAATTIFARSPGMNGRTPAASAAPIVIHA